jgi:alpha-tubulin suppressor-like RCC1 family protein
LVIPGATNGFLVLPQTSAADSGTYSVRVSNTFGAVESAGARLTVEDMAPAFSEQPVDEVAPATAITARVEGSWPMAYQWWHDGQPMAGAAGERFGPAQLWMSGNWWLVASNAFGAITSRVAHVTILPVAAWGDNSTGQTTVPAGLTNVVALAGGRYHSLALRTDGTVAAWGENFGYYNYGQATVPAGLTNVVAIAGGYYHSMALRADGTVAAWGDNNGGQPVGLTNVVAVAAGGYHSLALRADGTVAAWGWNYYGQTNVPAGLSNVVAIAAGNDHSLALRIDGTVAAWGILTNVPAGLSNLVAIASGYRHNLALRANGTVAAWGYDGLGTTTVPAGLSNVVAIAAGIDCSLALRADGTVTAWGFAIFVPAGLSNVVAIAMGSEHSLALVGAAPVITGQPQSRTNVAGTTASFSVAATGTAPLSYQWRFNGTPLSGQTGTGITLTNVQSTHAGNYDVVVTNFLGSVTSAVAVLTVWVPPSLTAQPQSRTNIAGTTASFSVTAAGTTPLAYQWQLNGTPVGSATGASYTITNVQAVHAGDYTVVVTNVAGSVTSVVAVLTVWVPPAITGQPQSRTNVAGTTASFSVAATGTAPLSYQWRFNGTPLAGQTGTNLTLTNVQSIHAGNYAVVVTNVAGSVTSVVATLTVWSAPSITAQPQSRTNVAGTTASFGVTAAGTAPLAYQWRLNGTPLGSATGTSYAITNVQAAHAGDYTVVVTNMAGSVTSVVATLTVLALPSITAQPQSRTNVAGTLASFSVAVTGTAPLSYQWRFNSTPLSGQTGTNLTLTNVQSIHAGNYAVVVTNFLGSVTSVVATLTVWSAPSITAQPQSRTNVAGTTASFSVTAAGTTPLAYQWQLNGTPLGSATGASYAITNVQADHAGDYTVVVTNMAGSVTSVVAALTVLTPPSITAQPQSRTNVTGTTGSFAVTAAGTAPLAYQWRLNGTPLGSATGASYAITNVQGTHAGAYTVVVTNMAGSVTSVVAALTVLTPPSITAQPQSRTNVAGTTASFSITAAGTTPLAYQWRLNGTPLGSATGTSYAITNVQAAHAGDYTVVVANMAGSVTSVVAALTVVTPPSITAQPQGRTNIAGTTASFSVTAAGTTPLAFQWRFNGTPLSGQTGTNLTLTNVQSIHAGNYAVVVTNVAGSVTSVVATLSVWSAPSITAQPQSRTNLSGTMASFSVSATGTPAPGYQWRKEGLSLAGQTNATLNLPNVQPTDSGNYTVVVSNSLNTVTSAVAVLTVWVVPSISAQPQSRTNVVGTTASFSVGAGGTAPLGYQWLFNGIAITGATNPTLTLARVQLAQAGAYSVIVSNLYGSETSAVATLAVNTVALWGSDWAVIPTGLTNVVAVAAGHVHSLALKADGTVVAWSVNTDFEYGQTNVPPGLTNVVAVDAGSDHSLALKADGTVSAWGGNWNFQSTVPLGLANVVAVAGGGAHSLALKSDGTVVAWGYNYYGQANVPLELTNLVAVAGGKNHSLALKDDGTVAAWGYNYYGQTNVPPGLTNVVAVAGGDYHSLALKGDGTVVAWGAGSPGGTSGYPDYGQATVPHELTNVVAIAGGEISSLALESDGTVVAWGISGSTNVPLGLTNVVAVAAGWHNLALVGDQPLITPLVNRTAVGGGTARFYVTASGARPLSYQWQLDGTNLPGATGAWLTLTNVQYHQAGAYAVVVSNSLGAITSTPPAVLTVGVSQPPLIVARSLVRTNGQFKFTLQSQPGSRFVIQASTNLVNWTNLVTVTNVLGTIPFTDTAANFKWRFYRAREQP